MEIWMILGFVLAAYSVVANDSVQTLGTFISSNQDKVKWRYLWLAASTVLIITISYGWYINNGDISYGKLSRIPAIEHFHWYHAAAPACLLLLTRFGIPVSTTFLVLSAFASSTIIEKMVMKSVVGYSVAAISAFAIWWILAKLINEHIPVRNNKKDKYWRIAQWCATGFLWHNWIAHDMANIAVYLPRKLSIEYLIMTLSLLVIGLGWIFYIQGGKIQKIVLHKSNTRYVRSATIIDFIYAVMLWFFKEYNNIPMSTTWVFVGLLTGRELAIYHLHKNKHMRTVFPILAKDFFKILLGLGISVLLVMFIVEK